MPNNLTVVSLGSLDSTHPSTELAAGWLRSVDTHLRLPPATQLLLAHDGLHRSATAAQVSAYAGYRQRLSALLRSRPEILAQLR